MDEIKQSYHKKNFLAGDIIFEEGAPADCAYIVETGQVEISVLLNGQSIVLGIAASGDLFGELGLINDDLRSASAQALDDAQLILIDRNMFKRKLDEADPIVTFFLRALLDRFQEVRSNLVTLKKEHEKQPAAQQRFNHNANYEADKTRTIHDIKLEANLLTALKEEEFVLYYQPITHLKKHAIQGFEALIRWQHPTRGLIPPSEFVSFSEKTGLIVPLGNWIIKEACRAQKILRNHFPDISPFISINISALQFEKPGLASTIAKIIHKYENNPEDIKLEITETLLMSNPEHASTTLHNLKKIGVKLAIDDFGTGYSSFNYLYRFPFDSLKIDKSFIDEILCNTKSAEIVRTLAHLAHNLGMTTIAEGVESPQQAARLLEYTCDFGQGNWISHPVALTDATALLAKFK